MSKETYCSVIQAGDMANVLQMRPITVSKETYYSVIQAGDMANVLQMRPITVSPGGTELRAWRMIAS